MELHPNRLPHEVRHGQRIAGLMLLYGSVILAFACREKVMVKQTVYDVNKIIGRWRSPPQGWRKGEWGPSQFVIELKPSGEIKVKWTVSKDSPGGGGVQSDAGTYRITDHTLSADVIARGDPVSFEFKDDRLILTLPPEAPDKPIEVYEFVRDEKGAEK